MNNIINARNLAIKVIKDKYLIYVLKILLNNFKLLTNFFLNFRINIFYNN